MDEFQSISRFDIENKLSSELLRISRIISSAMVIGPLLFLFVIIFLYFKFDNLSDTATFVNDINMFNYIIVIIAVLVYSNFLIFPKYYLKPDSIRKRLSEIFYDQNRKKIDDPVLKLIIFDRIFMIIRLAMLEGVALFGMVVLFRAVSSGQIYGNSLLWLWIIPFLILAVFSLNNYISKDKYVERIEYQILAPLKEI